MADLPVGNEGSLNGATAVTALAAPVAGKQRIIYARGAGIYNASGGALDYTFQKNKGGTLTVLQFNAAVADKGVARLEKVVVLDFTDESLEVFASGGAANSKFDVAALETT